MREFAIGDLVYKNYSPVQCGRIEEIIPGEPYPRWPNKPNLDLGNKPDTLVVKMLRKKGEPAAIYRGSEFEFRNFRKLVADAQRKLDGHLKTLARLENM